MPRAWAGSVKGVVGKIERGYYPAASLNNYVVTRGRDGWALTATVVAWDAFNLTQRPLVFLAPHTGGEWSWRIRALRFPEGDYPPARGPFTIRATLDPPDTMTRKGPIYVGLRSA